MKNIIKATLIASLMAVTAAPALADEIGVHVGPIGVGIGVGHHHHRVCEWHHHHRSCFYR